MPVSDKKPLTRGDFTKYLQVCTYPRVSKRICLAATIAEARRFLRHFSPRISSLLWSQDDDRSVPYQNGTNVLASISGHSKVLPTRSSAAPGALIISYNCEAVLAVMWYYSMYLYGVLRGRISALASKIRRRFSVGDY